MRSWGPAVGNLGKILWVHAASYPHLISQLWGYVGNPRFLYTSTLHTVPTVFHGKNLAFQTVRAAVLPTIHTTNKNKYISKKIFIVNRSA
jgi:hypothetical protein